MIKFEYKVLIAHGIHWFDGEEDFGKGLTTELLNSLGDQGWELVLSTQADHGTDRLVFKREISVS